MFEIVKKEIDKLNPYDLLPHAGADEFDLESKKIASRIKPESSKDEIAQIISTVLATSFDNQHFDVEYCKEAADNIYEAIHN